MGNNFNDGTYTLYVNCPLVEPDIPLQIGSSQELICGMQYTGGTHLNVLYSPESKEIASLEGLTFRCPEINLLKWPLVY